MKENLIVSERVTQKIIPIAETKMKSFLLNSGQVLDDVTFPERDMID